MVKPTYAILLIILTVIGVFIGSMLIQTVKEGIQSAPASSSTNADREVAEMADGNTVMEVGEVVFYATAELQSALISLQSMIVPQSIELQFGEAQVVIDGPIPEVSVMLMTLAIAAILMWRFKRR